MSISSSIYVGATGVLAQQQSMSVISDNIANISTTGFKSSRVLFDTLISDQLTGASSGNQVGKGVRVSSIYQDMTTVGGMESTTSSTDMAVSGTYGYFMVSPEGSDNIYYTRAGHFTFDQDGYLRDASGNILQGYTLPVGTSTTDEVIYPDATSATLGDIILNTDDASTAISHPEPTGEVIMMVNLDPDEADRSTSETSPLTALFDSWDATQDSPLGNSEYAYASSMYVYDDAGQSHTLTVYFDPVEEETGSPSGSRTWEYLITIPVDDDASALDTKSGILMAGTLTFASSGTLTNMSAFTGTTDDKTTWVPAELTDEGLPVMSALFEDGTSMNASWNIGLTGATAWDIPSGVTSMADLTTDYDTLPALLSTTPTALATTSYNSGTSTIYRDQDGYPEGYLKSVSVDTSGQIIGEYSNGQSQLLFKVPLADFMNAQGLHREGGNLFSATTQSGAASIGWAGENRLSEISGATLEQSNVDLATEFSNMIITQKAFDANSKVITTSDQVVQTALGIKR